MPCCVKTVQMWARWSVPWLIAWAKKIESGSGKGDRRDFLTCA